MRRIHALGLTFVFLFSCKEEPKKETSAPKSPQAIPSDFVVNSFFGLDGGNTPPSSRQAPPEPQQPAEPPEPEPASKAGAPQVSTVKLLEPGEEPRAVRRYDLKQGKQETLSVVVKPSMTQEIAGQKAGGGAQPPTQFTIAIVPQAKTPTGDFDVKFTLVKAEIAPGADEAAKKMAAQLAAPLRALAGLSGAFRVGPRGTLGQFSLAGDAGAAAMQSDLLPLVQQSLEGLVVAMPEEAVGKGAKWEDRASGKQQGLSSNVVSTYTLKDVAADGLTLSVTTTRKAAPQPIPDPRAPPGSTLAIDGTASSNVRLKLDRMVMKATSDSSTSLIITQPGAGGPQVVTQRVVLKQSIENTTP